MMPVISIFFGIIIRINFDDHNPPHFHAEYQDDEACFDINTGEISDGKLPKRFHSLVRKWAKEHKEELLNAWNLAKAGKPTFRIKGAHR